RVRKDPGDALRFRAGYPQEAMVDRRHHLADYLQRPAVQDVVAAHDAAGERVLDRQEPEVDLAAGHRLPHLRKAAPGHGRNVLREIALDRFLAEGAKLALEGYGGHPRVPLKPVRAICAAASLH